MASSSAQEQVVVESLTDEVEAAALDLMRQVEDMGGAVAAIERGFQKAEIERSAYEITQQIDAGARTVVGMNKFTVDEVEHYEPLRVNPLIEQEQGARLAKLRSERDGVEVSRLLQLIRETAKSDANLLYPIKDALRARATVGEVSDALRDVWGQYQPADRF